MASRRRNLRSAMATATGAGDGAVVTCALSRRDGVAPKLRAELPAGALVVERFSCPIGHRNGS